MQVFFWELWMQVGGDIRNLIMGNCVYCIWDEVSQKSTPHQPLHFPPHLMCRDYSYLLGEENIFVIDSNESLLGNPPQHQWHPPPPTNPIQTHCMGTKSFQHTMVEVLGVYGQITWELHSTVWMFSVYYHLIGRMLWKESWRGSVLVFLLL